jgi:hypothetical protein
MKADIRDTTSGNLELDSTGAKSGWHTHPYRQLVVNIHIDHHVDGALRPSL